MKGGDKKRIDGIKIIRFRLFLFSSSSSFAPAPTRRAARPRPSSTGGVHRPWRRGEGVFYRDGDIWEERERRGKQRRAATFFFFLPPRAGRFSTSSAESESFVTTPFSAFFFLSVVRVSCRVVRTALLEIHQRERNARCLADRAR